MQEKSSYRIRNDLVVVVLFTVIGTFLVMMVDLFENIYEISRPFEKFELDGLIFGLPLFAAIGLAWFAYRRFEKLSWRYFFESMSKNPSGLPNSPWTIHQI